VVIFITLALLLVSVIVAVVIYMGKSKCPHRNYTGTQETWVVSISYFLCWREHFAS
jgi:hypothetical protein